MREPEFLPDFYPLLLRRRNMVVAQIWATILLVVWLSSWALYAQHQVHLAQLSLDEVDGQIRRSGVDLLRLSEIEVKTAELERKQEISQRLGVRIAASRILDELNHQMPPGMALLEMNLGTEESAEPQSDADRALGHRAKIDRKLAIELTGMAPTGGEVATFLTHLVAVPYFTDVGLVKAEDHAENWRLMRQFVVKFALDLDSSDAPAVASAGDQ
jgi:Tfp pilus assembly protein PilN